MLFNSYTFIFLFLPLALIVYFLFGSKRVVLAKSWLVFASLFYYAWWNPLYLGLLLASMFANYGIGNLLGAKSFPLPARKLLLGIGITANVLLLCYFKYTFFIINNINTVFETNWNIGSIILPLGISFFTFQKIAYLCDSFKRETKCYRLLDYMLFIVFFPSTDCRPNRTSS